MSLTVAQLDLSPVAMAGAYELQRQCPWVIFTSGRRTLQEQAHAMACNVAVKRDFILKTYLHGPVLQQQVDRHPQWVTVEQLEYGLADYMRNDMDPGTLGLLSKHLQGEAFDVLPIVDPQMAGTTIGVIHTLAGLTKFLQREAGLPRWHCEFVATPENLMPFLGNQEA